MATIFCWLNPHLNFRHARVSPKRHEIGIYKLSCFGSRIGSRMWSVEWHHFYWRWMTLTPPNCRQCFRFLVFFRGQLFQKVCDRSSPNFQDCDDFCWQHQYTGGTDITPPWKPILPTSTSPQTLPGHWHVYRLQAKTMSVAGPGVPASVLVDKRCKCCVDAHTNQLTGESTIINRLRRGV